MQRVLVLSAVLGTVCIVQMAWGIYKLVSGTHLWVNFLVGFIDNNIFTVMPTVNMDYLFLSSIALEFIILIIIAYDIACQWMRNILARLDKSSTPSDLRLALSKNITYLVPKFHLESHTPKCHAPFSFNYTVGVGRTDGEGVERNWSQLNGIVSSLSQMTAGGRWDTMDDFCNFANWRKTVEARAWINILVY